MRHFRSSARGPAPLVARLRTLGTGAALALAAAACERAKSPPRVDSIRVGADVPTPDTPGATATTSEWDASLGKYLLVAGSTPGEALLIDPERHGTVTAGEVVDSAALRGLEATLFGSGGARASAKLDGPIPATAGAECSPPWTVVRLAGETTTPWTVGVVGAGGEAIPMDSLEGLTTADSAALVADAARAASSLPVKDEAYFRGLPFSVHSLQRFTPVAGVQAFAALLVRRVNQEDSPLEERTFLVAEHDSTAAAWRVAYHERSAGTEDEVESSEALAALTLGTPRRPSLLIVHEVADGVAYRILERTGPARWRARWTSALGRCR
jgi:hypothetical protein